MSKVKPVPSGEPVEPPFVPCVRASFERRVALEVERKGKESRVITIEAEGLSMCWEPTAKFVAAHGYDAGIEFEKACFSFLRANARAYLNNADAVGKIMETIMTTSTGTADLSELSLAQLTEHYNRLAQGLGKNPVKSFKSKGEATKRIQSLGAEAAQPTPEQAQNKEASRAAADKRLSGLADLKASRAERKAAEGGKSKKSKKSTQSGATAGEAEEPTVATTKSTKKSPAAKKPAAKAKAAPAKKPAAKAKAETEKKPRGQGIGAFCCELIAKGKSNEEVAEAAQKKFGSKTSASSVAWYRNKMRAEGKL